jgi:hypothetical protein
MVNVGHGPLITTLASSGTNASIEAGTPCMTVADWPVPLAALRIDIVQSRGNSTVRQPSQPRRKCRHRPADRFEAKVVSQTGKYISGVVFASRARAQSAPNTVKLQLRLVKC